MEIKVVTPQKFRQFWPYSCGTVVNVNFNHPCVINQYFAQHFSIHWKKNHLIDNNIINLVTCRINSHNYADLIDIKDKLKSLSQFKSIKTMVISNNNNVVKIEFYGDYSIFVKSLLLNKIEIKTHDKCMIRSIK